MDQYQPELICNILQQMTPRNVRVTVVGQKFSGMTNQTEKWYGTPYSVCNILQSTLQTWEDAGIDAKFYLPSTNKFIPENLNLLPVMENTSSHPILIQETNFRKLWYKQRESSSTPKSSIFLNITSSHAKHDLPSFHHYLNLFEDLFTDSVMKHSYPASLADLNFDFDCDPIARRITLCIDCFNDKQQYFLQTIIDSLTAYSVNEKHFNVIKETYLRKCKNFETEQPYDKAESYCYVILGEDVLSTTDGVLEITAESLTHFITHFFSCISVDMFVCGNVTSAQAMKLVDIVEKSLQTVAKPLVHSEQIPVQECKLPARCDYLYQHHYEVHNSSALLAYYQCPAKGNQDYFLLPDLFQKIIAEPYFNTFRNKQQLGYIVKCDIKCTESGINGLTFVIQSDQHPEYLEEKLEKFLDQIESYINDTSADALLYHSETLAYEDMQIGDTRNFWKEIMTHKLHFERSAEKDKYIDTLMDTITMQDIIDFYNQYIKKNSPERRKLCVYVLGKDQELAAGKQTTSTRRTREIVDLSELKNSLEVRPLTN